MPAVGVPASHGAGASTNSAIASVVSANGASAHGDHELAPHPSTRADGEWAQLWFAIQRHSWSTLAVVPAERTQNAFGPARALAVAGHVYRAGAVKMIDATKADAREIQGIIAAAKDAAAAGAQVVIALGSPLVNPAAIAIARAADAVVLAVPLGEAMLADSRRVIESIGREHFIGSVAVRQPKATRVKKR
ncbi:hypothetical protein J421_0134 [Gemmatirosa kalamazoonensis]|uniref:Uncharacterized protein n=1 Tax=Gemmatirosa kalamazoonensis TaxID=861299 RepID=W0RA43_9BACT|nr:hypothetical protein J421_0134 [Gemmatirosa kalamazoonensis]